MESNFVGVNRLFVLVYSNDDSKRFKAKRYYLSKGKIKSYNVILNGKSFYDQSIDSDAKRCKKIRKLATGEGEDCTTGYLLNYDYIKNHYRLIAVDLCRQKELNDDPRSSQQIELVGQLKNPDDVVVGNECMFVLTILEKIKETRLKFSQGSATVL